jgi:hypothetical protein
MQALKIESPRRGSLGLTIRRRRRSKTNSVCVLSAKIILFLPEKVNSISML